MTESERDELEMLLAALPADVLPLDAMHGFMTALVMADDSTPMATWAQGLLHTADTPLALPSPTDDLTTRFARLLSRMRTEIEVALDDPDYLFAPMVRMYPRENGDDRKHPANPSIPGALVR